MSYYLYKPGCYFVDLADARKLMDSLNIEYSTVREDLYERPISNWLCENNKLHIRAAHILWPETTDDITVESKGGMMICTKNGTVPYQDTREDRTEEKKDLETKEWMMKNGVETAIKWVCVVDIYEIMRTGMRSRWRWLDDGKMTSMEEFRVLAERETASTKAFLAKKEEE